MTLAAIPERTRALPQANRRRRRILDASLRVIADGGIDALTHRRVAAEAGVALGSTTYYFRSRQELICEAFRHYLREADRGLADLAQSHRDATLGSVVAFGVAIARREFADPQLVRAEYELILAATRDPELRGELRSWENALIGRLAEWLELLGAVRPVDAAQTLLHLMRGFELEKLNHPEAPLEDLERRLTAVLSGFVPGPPS